MKSRADTANGPRAMSAVQPQHTSVLVTRNGMRRGARSVMAPSSGDTTKMMPIDTAVMMP